MINRKTVVRSRSCRLEVAVCVFLAVLAAAPAEGGVDLVRDGTARAVVITADDPTPVAKHAANELIDHIERATGVRLDLATESTIPDPSQNRVYIGDTRAARTAGIDVDALTDEAAVLRATDRALYIVGRENAADPLDQNNRHSGTLWGVYELLDRDLGVRWLWPGPLGAHVPATDRIHVGERDERLVPHFTRRRLRTARSRWNDPRIGFSPEGLERYEAAQTLFLRRHRMGRGEDPRPYTGHSFGRWWRTYGAEHPEWFQKLPPDDEIDPWLARLPEPYRRSDGLREDRRGPANPDRSGFVSMCVSNPDLHREIVARWARRHERNPEALRINIGENDIPAFCVCAACRALDDPQPDAHELAAMSPNIRALYEPFNAGARYAHFWQRVHAKAAAIDPNVIVTAYVYMNYFVAPDPPFELHPNITLGFVPWQGWANWMPPRSETEQQWLMDQWDRWVATGATLYYRPNSLLDGYAMPYVYTRELAALFQHFAANGMIGTDYSSLTGQWAVQGPTLYVLTRLHTRPFDDLDALLAEYYQAFGPAAGHVEAYFDFWEAHTRQLRGGQLAWHAAPAHRMFPPESFQAAGAHLERAAAAAGDADGIYARRVAFLRDGLTHARLTAAMTARFADRDADRAQQREALESLAAFRRAVEDRLIANYSPLCREPFEGRWVHALEE